MAVSKLFLMPGAELPRASSNHKQEANPPFWFSYDYGSAHFTTISTEHDLSSGSSQRRARSCLARTREKKKKKTKGHSLGKTEWATQRLPAVFRACSNPTHSLWGISVQWMQRDLAGVNRCRTPWVVLLSHRPMYVVHPHKSNRIVGGEPDIKAHISAVLREQADTRRVWHSDQRPHRTRPVCVRHATRAEF